jgi:HEAT repeat protein
VDPDPNAAATEAVEWAKRLVAAPLTVDIATELIEVMISAEPARSEMAAWALGAGELPGSAQLNVIEALCDVLCDTTRPAGVRSHAAEALAAQIGASAPHSSGRDAATTALMGTLGDPDSGVRFWSAFALGELRAVEALPALHGLVTDENLVDGWWTVGEEATDAIASIEGRTPPERVRT